MDQLIASTPQEPYQSTQNSLSPISPEPPKSFGWLKWVLVVLIVALFSSGTTYFVMNQSQKSQPLPQVTQTTPTPPPDPTANWKTYINKDVGYSIRYPATLDETYYRSSVGSFIQLYLPDLNTEDISEKNMHITDGPNTYTTLKEAIDNHVNQNRLDKIERSPYALSGTAGEMIMETSTQSGIERRSVWIQKEKTILIFEVRYRPENQTKTIGYFNQILSTFKFLE